MGVRYSTNKMGIVSLQWYIGRGLTQKKTITMTEDSLLVKYANSKPGDTVEIDDVIEPYSCGRLDFWNPEYSSVYPDEMGVPPMRSEDWSSFGNWLHTFESDGVLSLEEIVQCYEKTNPKIRWWKDE